MANEYDDVNIDKDRLNRSVLQIPETRNMNSLMDPITNNHTGTSIVINNRQLPIKGLTQVNNQKEKTYNDEDNESIKSKKVSRTRSMSSQRN